MDKLFNHAIPLICVWILGSKAAVRYMIQCVVKPNCFCKSLQYINAKSWKNNNNTNCASV